MLDMPKSISVLADFLEPTYLPISSLSADGILEWMSARVWNRVLIAL